jgi:hypothetical protein
VNHNGHVRVSPEGEDNRRYRGAWLKTTSINVLRQTRQTFDDIDPLAQSVAEDGLLNPVTVARFTPEASTSYLRWFETFWNEEFALKDLCAVSENGKPIYYFLLAGERRLRAHRHLWENGCKNCRDHYGPERPGRCFRRHLGHGNMIETRLAAGITPARAMQIQLAENTHMAVPAHQEAIGHYNLWRVRRAEEPKLSLVSFARSVGRSEEKIRSSFRYAQLPAFIRSEVETGHIKYGIALQLSRLQVAGIDPDELRHWMREAMLGRWGVPRLEARVNDWIRDKESGQSSLLDVFSDVSDRDWKRELYRKTVEREILNVLWGNQRYAATVLRMLRSGELDREDSPYSMLGPLQMLAEWLRQLEQIASEINPKHPKTATRLMRAATTTAALVRKRITKIHDADSSLFR